MVQAGADTNARSYGFPRARRVTRGPEIEQVRKEGKRVRTASMDVRAVASLQPFGTPRDPMPAPTSAVPVHGRVGLIVPKYGHGSVDRNKVKRRLREIVRVETLPVMPPFDIVVRIAPRAYERSFAELRDEVRKWTRQLRQLQPPIPAPKRAVDESPPGHSA